MDIPLQVSRKSLPLQRVFHSIRFKVNKGWSSAELLFLCPYVGTKKNSGPEHPFCSSPEFLFSAKAHFYIGTMVNPQRYSLLAGIRYCGSGIEPQLSKPPTPI